MDHSISKETHPQKHYFKTISNIMFYLGMGECWYGTRYKFTKTQKILYKIWMFIANLFIFGGMLNEHLAFFRTDLNEKQEHDLMQFTFAHPTAAGKVLLFYWRKKRVVELLEPLLEGSRPIFNSLKLERDSIKLSFMYGLYLIVSIYMALVSATFDSVRLYIQKGMPISPEVVFYPQNHSTGLVTNVLRLLSTIHWYYLMAMMICVDCIVVTAIITTKFKFENVQLFFHNIREKLTTNTEEKSLEERREEFKKDFKAGIRLHQDALWCARAVQDTLGPIYSLEVFLCVGLIVISLLKLVSAERNMFLLLTNIAYMGCLLALAAIYMIPCGDVTYQASLVSTAIFQCGWDLVYARSDIRALVVVTLQNSQIPVYMTAYDVIILSHTNFISLLRSSYSFFSVMY